MVLDSLLGESLSSGSGFWEAFYPTCCERSNTTASGSYIECDLLLSSGTSSASSDIPPD